MWCKSESISGILWEMGQLMTLEDGMHHKMGARGSLYGQCEFQGQHIRKDVTHRVGGKSVCKQLIIWVGRIRGQYVGTLGCNVPGPLNPTTYLL